MNFKPLLLTLFALFSFAASLVAQTTQGYATYYGSKWHGRRSADGSVFSNDSLTCAHKTLPFGTILHVRNPKNGKEVLVKVTDRGPFRANTLIDLSQAAAKEIDMMRAGVAMVEVTNLSTGVDYPRAADNVPELQLLDPVTGKFYTMGEWQRRADRQKSISKARAEQQKLRLTAQKASKARYRVGRSRLTAQAKRK